MLNNNNLRFFSIYNLETMFENTYLCTVFFMVLDLRLTKDCGCRETTLSILNTFPIFPNASPSKTLHKTSKIGHQADIYLGFLVKKLRNNRVLVCL
jgi:hypothetical protein